MYSVEVFPWSANFETGLPQIDAQHQRLVELLNVLAGHLVYQSDIPPLNHVLNDLAEYAVYHFQTEENLWHAYLPEDAWETRHKEDHSQFMTKVNRLMGEEKIGPLDQVIKKILAFLIQWLAFHILDADMRLAKAVLAIQSGLTITQAKVQAEQKMYGAKTVLLKTILAMFDTLSARTMQLAKEVIERQKAEQASQDALNHLQKIASQIPGMVFQFQLFPDGSCCIPYANEAIRTIYRVSPEAVSEDAAPLLAALHPDDLDNFKTSIRVSARDLTPWSQEYRLQFNDAPECWLMGNALPQREADGSVLWHGFITDITLRKAAEEEIKQLAFYDPLTQLPNRRLLLERLEHSIEMRKRDGRQMALLMLDLDHMKAVNDSWGHLAGDELLQQVGGRISARLRRVDTVARLGGDEFVVLLEDIAHKDDAAQVAAEIILALNQSFQLSQSNDVQIGASIGISLYPQHGCSREILMDHADAALYQAKDQGRGCYAYYSEDQSLLTRARIAMETQLRRAIKQGELRLFYQPQVNIASGRIVGAEALLRWQDPVEGLIQPLRFIAIAEETGLILEIGEWVLRETCWQGRHWLDAGLPPLTLAVNISPQQLRRGDISALVAAILLETGFPAEYLELEITESGLMKDQDKILEILNKLSSQGIHLAIDDFGTGFSSLAYLKRFPLNVLKIDNSFINGICLLQDNIEITSAIIAMGHILGLKVLAEGVETMAQLAFMQEKRCDTYQGYIKSPPVPAEAFVDLLHHEVFN